MARGMIGCAVSVAAVCLAAGSALAQSVITQWNFNSPVPDNNISTGTIAPSIGSGVASPTGGINVSFASGAASGGSSDPAIDDDSGWQTTSYPLPGTGNKSAGPRFSVSTCGFTGITVNFDVRHSNSSSRWVRFQYTLDGSVGSPVWIDGPLFNAGTGASGDTWFNVRSADLSAVTGVNNNQNFSFRVVTEFAPSTTDYIATQTTYAATGTLRYDMVTVNGTSSGGCGQPSLGNLQVEPGAVCLGEQVLITVPAVPGTNPASTGLAVRVNLAALGGSTTQPLFDNGQNGDVTGGDGIYSLLYTVPTSATPALNALVPATVSDAQGRSATTSATLNVSDCSGLGQVVISQVYGGGGNTGAVYNYDFIELFNRGATPVNITGWAVQYASANGAFTAFTQLSGTIQPGKYFLIRQDGTLGGEGQPLPQPWDAIGIIGVSSSSGRVALTAKGVALIDCADPLVSDLVTYGNTATTCYEGFTGPAPILDNVTAVFRSNNGCIDTNDNAADFYRATPNARNSASAPFFCTGTAPAGVASFGPSEQCAGSTVNFDVQVTPGTGPASTGLTVTADLSAIGGSASTILTDLGGGLFRATVAINPNLTPGGRGASFVVSDAQNRRTGGGATVIVQRCQNIASGVTDPSAVCRTACGTLRVVVFVSAADTPAPDTLSVTADLSGLGGSATQTLFDDGTNGDYSAFDNVFAFELPYSAGLPASGVPVPFVVSDNLGRETTGTITLAVLPSCTDAGSTVRISQIFGGGGNAGALWDSDYVELYNSGPNAVDLNGWSVQYASRAGNFTAKVDLTGSIAGNSFYLVKLASGTSGLSLPTPDAVGSISIDNSDGKIALVSSTVLLGSSCSGASVVDLVGYGDEASCFEGSGPATQPSNTLAVFRVNRGCTDRDDNAADFETGFADPFNSLSPAIVCSVPVCPGVGCPAEYNRDGTLNLDDLSDFITDFYTVPAIPGGLQVNAPTYSESSTIGFAVPCPEAGDGDGVLYAVNAYRQFGYRVGYSADGSNSCPASPEQNFPSLDNLSDYITLYYSVFGQAPCVE
jgi:hypothetical protein